MSTARASIILILALFLLPMGCKKDDDSPTSPGVTIPADIVGTWTLQSATLNGEALPLSVLFDWTEGTVSATIKVESSGACTYTEYDAQSQALFTSGGAAVVTGSNVTITFTTANGQPLQPPKVLAGVWTVVGDTLTLTSGSLIVTATK